MQDRNSNDRGKLAEHVARKYLERRGLNVVTTNFRTRWGEIDLVMEQNRQIVFVEVRYRVNNSFGGAAASVTLPKQQRLLRAASQFLEQHGLAHRPARFDIVAIEGGSNRVEWLMDAFQAHS